MGGALRDSGYGRRPRRSIDVLLGANVIIEFTLGALTFTFWRGAACWIFGSLLLIYVLAQVRPLKVIPGDRLVTRDPFTSVVPRPVALHEVVRFEVVDNNAWYPRGSYGVRAVLVSGRTVQIQESCSFTRSRAAKWHQWLSDLIKREHPLDQLDC